jgi:hypothetical protein
MASFLGHQRPGGDSGYGADREVALRDVFVTIQENALTSSVAGCARRPVWLWEAGFQGSTGFLRHWKKIEPPSSPSKISKSFLESKMDRE